ncbi:hypothetical protein F441_02529 [Phytophthora nicotianae CJ01A1]|uniref:Uncharacterized protein n=2 Tax=Phytophthora nicotianae TaxID=4792 RepID=W2XPQ3_PHYNI|nr:hypothetical protein F441_02529 [Phytophthora nicotianae CJ01A1]
MMKAKSAVEYRTYRQDMLRLLGNDKKDPFFERSHRDNFPHLNNHTNNRIESGWGKIKQLVDREDSIDELTSTLILLQEWSEEQYLEEFTSLGTRQTPDAEDAKDEELSTLALQVSPHAYRLVRDQYK